MPTEPYIGWYKNFLSRVVFFTNPLVSYLYVGIYLRKAV